MTRKSPTEAAITARIEALNAALAEQRGAIRTALLAGRSTAAARAEVARVEGDIEAAHAELAALLADRAAAKADAIEAAGRGIATATAAELDAQLAALKAPPHPNHPEI
jgi:hypothetical protein